MAKESFIFLIYSIPFKKVPQEWISPEMKLALERVSNDVGSWFEASTEKILNKIGYFGFLSCNKQIGTKELYLKIPKEVGEIDFIGYSERNHSIILCECKAINSGSEARFFKDDLDKFILKKKNYYKQFQKKIKWVNENIEEIENVFRGSGIMKSGPKMLNPIFITYYPSIVDLFIEDIPCKSITNFILDYNENKNWPYTNGRIML